MSSVTREEKEFEEQKNECTFKPQLVTKNYKPAQKYNHQIASKMLGVDLTKIVPNTDLQLSPQNEK